SAVGARVHLHAATDGSGNRAHELEASQLGGPGTMQADGERRSCAGGEEAILDLRGRELPAELEDEARIALVCGKQIGTEPDRGDGQILLARPGKHLHELLDASRAPEPVRRPSRAERRVLR